MGYKNKGKRGPGTFCGGDQGSLRLLNASQVATPDTRRIEGVNDTLKQGPGDVLTNQMQTQVKKEVNR